MFLSIKPHPEGLPSREFNKHLDGLLEHGKLNPEILEYMNITQQVVINEVKKALVRFEKRYDERETIKDTVRTGRSKEAIE